MPTYSLVSGGLVSGTTTLSQARYTTIVNNDPVYQVSNLLYDAGQLPDNGVFLYEVTDAADSTADNFVRVVHPADFDAYPNDRVTAVRVASSYYRAASWTATYSDLTVAIVAARDAKEQVNALVNEWINYVYEFGAGPPGDQYELPTTDETVLAGLISSWQAAKEAVPVAEDELIAANAAVTSAAALLTLKESHRDQVVALHSTITKLSQQSVELSSFIESIQDAVAQLGVEPVPFPQATGGTALWGDVNTLVTTLGGIPAAASARTSFLTTGIPKLETITTGLTGSLASAVSEYDDMSTEVGEAGTAQTLANEAVAAAKQDLANAERTAATALNTYNNAVTYESDLYASLKEICPTFDPLDPLASVG